MIGRACLVVMLVSAPLASALAADFVARGNEPGWMMRKADDGIAFRPMEGSAVAVSPLPAVQTTGGAETYQATVGGEPFKLTIATSLCVDTMSGMPFPASVTVELGAKKFTGCGGEPESLLRGEWTVEAIDGKPIAKGSEPTLDFGEDGMLSGNASCNRYFGKFSLTGEGLTVTKPGTSMMMCEQPLMDQEAAFPGILQSVARFEIGPGGSLILHSATDKTITGRRKS